MRNSYRPIAAHPFTLSLSKGEWMAPFMVSLSNHERSGREVIFEGLRP